jgi:hypothetical protein
MGMLYDVKIIGYPGPFRMRKTFMTGVDAAKVMGKALITDIAQLHRTRDFKETVRELGLVMLQRERFQWSYKPPAGVTGDSKITIVEPVEPTGWYDVFVSGNPPTAGTGGTVDPRRQILLASVKVYRHK